MRHITMRHMTTPGESLYAVCVGAIIRTVFHGVLHRLARLQTPGAAAMFGVVVDKHVVGHGQYVAVYRHRAGQDHLKGGTSGR